MKAADDVSTKYMLSYTEMELANKSVTGIFIIYCNSPLRGDFLSERDLLFGKCPIGIVCDNLTRLNEPESGRFLLEYYNTYCCLNTS